MDIIMDDDMIREIGGSRNQRDWTSGRVCVCGGNQEFQGRGRFQGRFFNGTPSEKKEF